MFEDTRSDRIRKEDYSRQGVVASRGGQDEGGESKMV